MSESTTMPALRSAFTGRRGVLLVGLLLTELAAAVQSIAYSSVLPLAAQELHGRSLYGATLAAGTLANLLVLSTGYTISSARRALFVATVLYLVGVALSATAPAMWLVLAGSVVRGGGGGLLAGFGMAAIGGLFEDTLRRRVLGLFALIWLVPSIAGPPLNGLLAAAFGWRWALVWPALVLLAARLLVGREARIVPWTPSERRVPTAFGVAVVLGVVVASVAPAAHAWWGVAVLAGGVTLAVVAAVGTVRALLHVTPRLLRGVLMFFTLTLAFFGGNGLVALAVVDGLGRGALAGSIALGCGLVAWSLVGLRPPRSGVLVAPALGALAVGLGGLALSQLDVSGLAVVVVSWTVAGAAMVVAYSHLNSAPFDGLDGAQVTEVATAVVFAELASTTIDGLVGGGTFSTVTAAGAGSRPAIGTACVVLATVAAGAAVAQFGGASRSRRAGTSSVMSG